MGWNSSSSKSSRSERDAKSLSISDSRDEIIDLIKEDLAVVAGGYPLMEIGDSYESLCESFQALGICNLLMSADTEGLFRNLVLSGYTRRFFLRQAGDAVTDFHAISRTSAIFDLIAANDMVLARELVTLSPSRWIEDGEYEDDFDYYSVVHALVDTAGSPDPELNRRLEQFETNVTDDTAPKLAVLQALVAGDADGFQAAFMDLVVARETSLEERAPDEGDDPRSAARASVFVEGIALLRLAQAAGIAPAHEIRLCPSSVLEAGVAGPVHDIYADMAEMMG